MPKLTITTSFMLPEDPLQSAQAQVAILTAAETFRGALSKTKIEHEYGVHIGDGPAAEVVKQRKTRKTRTSALGSAPLTQPQEPAAPPPIEPAAPQTTAATPPAVPSVPWARRTA